MLGLWVTIPPAALLYCQLQAGRSSGGVLLSVECLSAIWKPEQLGDLGSSMGSRAVKRILFIWRVRILGNI